MLEWWKKTKKQNSAVVQIRFIVKMLEDSLNKSSSRESHQQSNPCLATVKPQGVSSLPETLRVSTPPPERLGDGTPSRRKDGGRFSSTTQLPLTSKTAGGGAPSQGSTDDFSVQPRESLRWEGALEDPQAEERRLELYRANRRQRYISHRERLCWKKSSTKAETKSGNVHRVHFRRKIRER